ncbi:hypothetical protein HY249_01110 [Candidatus Azambacteria bacterium]|nr:hypothetical protein [Candidatus Azambacteria bacterium]
MPNLSQFKEKIEKNKEKIALFAQFLLVGALFFGLGVLYEQNSIAGKKSLRISQNEQILATVGQFSSSQENSPKKPQNTAQNQEKTQSNKQANKQEAQAGEFLFLASKNGKTYYKTSCSNRIKEENKIYFKTEDDAQRSGFVRSKSCFK